MPGLYKDEGVVLKSIPLGEADRIVTVFTRVSGKVRAVAKGVRKTKSRFGGRLEPFTRVSLVIYRGRELDTITSADILTSHREVRASLARLTAAGAVVEIVDKITPERERALPAYALLVRALQALCDDRAPTVVPAFTLKLLSLSGYHPELGRCAECGAAAGLCGFSAAAGGALCAGCGRGDRSAIEMARDRIALMADLLASDFGVQAAPAAAMEITVALRRYAEYHLERPLRSPALHAAP